MAILNDDFEYIFINTGHHILITESNFLHINKKLNSINNGVVLLGVHDAVANDIKYIDHKYFTLNNLLRKIKTYKYDGSWFFQCKNILEVLPLFDKLNEINYNLYRRRLDSIELDDINKILFVNFKTKTD